MTKRILVAGGGGFLGINLCKSLLEEGHEVICLDNFSSGSKSNLELVSSFRNFTLLEQDVTEPVNLNVDEIYNMACVASPVQYQADPLQTIRTSTEGINNLLKLAVAKKARIFQSSTSEVYGNPHVHPQQEDCFGNVNPVGPRACYDEGKRCAETLCMDYHRMFNVDVKIARIFNTYGPYMQPNDGRVVSNFIVQALMNRPITIYGDGSQTRSFCYVDDMIAGIRALMKTPHAVVGPVNLGNPVEFTVLELATKVIEMTDSSSRIQFYPLPQDDPIKRRPDISRANRLLNWQPRVKLEQGLEKTIQYFEQLLHNDALIAASKSAAGLGVSPLIKMER
ncbi:MAG: UDP-glucuronic acid decarboxylase family protein [Cellvibrio sp.]